MPGGNKNIKHEDGKPFQKGQSGNPKGRPKKYKTLFEELATDEDRKAMVLKLIEKAKRGDLAAFREIMDRVDGRPVQTVEAKINSEPAQIIVKDQATADALDKV